jgi:hypothetical protein
MKLPHSDYFLAMADRLNFSRVVKRPHEEPLHNGTISLH